MDTFSPHYKEEHIMAILSRAFGRQHESNLEMEIDNHNQSEHNGCKSQRFYLIAKNE